jgi:hypothetical protein
MAKLPKRSIRKNLFWSCLTHCFPIVFGHMYFRVMFLSFLNVYLITILGNQLWVVLAILQRLGIPEQCSRPSLNPV